MQPRQTEIDTTTLQEILSPAVYDEIYTQYDFVEHHTACAILNTGMDFVTVSGQRTIVQRVIESVHLLEHVRSKCLGTHLFGETNSRLSTSTNPKSCKRCWRLARCTRRRI